MTYASQKPPMPSPHTPHQLVALGYYQVSRAHCLLASLPRGQTGREALATATRGASWGRQRAMGMDEHAAADQYLRHYAPCIVVPRGTLAGYRAAGGGAYRTAQRGAVTQPALVQLLCNVRGVLRACFQGAAPKATLGTAWVCTATPHVAHATPLRVAGYKVALGTTGLYEVYL